MTASWDGAPRGARPVSVTHVLNGRAGGYPGSGERTPGVGSPRRPGWVVRLTFAWDPASPAYAWLTVTTEPSRPGPPTGAWIVPLEVLEVGFTQMAAAGSVTVRPDTSPGKMVSHPVSDPARPDPAGGVLSSRSMTVDGATDGQAWRQVTESRSPSDPHDVSETAAALDQAPERLWLEIRHVRGVWTADVPARWVRRFLDEVHSARGD